MSRVVYLSPSSELHGGIRVLFEHAEGLTRRGWDVTVAGPEPAPDWHSFEVDYEQRPIFESGGVPEADVVIATFYTTVEPACAAVAAGKRASTGQVFHFCQGWEGSHREYAPILRDIDRAYARPVPKLLVSGHLQPILEERYGCRCHLVGQAIDHELFRPGPFEDEPKPLRVGVVGPFGLRPKAISEALEGLRRVRESGLAVEVHRASTLPYSKEEQAMGVTDVFHHRLTTPEMAHFYRGIDALVFPSHDEEGFGLPVLEAMASGVPVAAGDIRPLRVLPGDSLVRFPPGNVDAIAEAVRQLADPQHRRRLHAEGLKAASGFTLDAVLDRLEAAFAAHGIDAPVRV